MSHHDYELLRHELKNLLRPPDVEKLKAIGKVEGLIKALQYKEDADVRRAAAEALVKIGERAVEPLITCLGDEYGWVRRAVAEALKRIGTGRALEALREFQG